ncbi:50S ribosomal protein L25/general stress protein Ctc [Planococcus lenghuensis]|uniref:Large ribosomal subunit protein bL25 n=1 Tax=Planococcus lenghuensis TaxID=2213202 RepID=A0A1Q2KU36_9BACL|nr:50S ribosomal protein L25/general stress protein Ctc [Planococcus lenghuensis]AQQ51718.1 50S ribosomal protein L25/general stress protein Ctc [Planococcus lenghuensis]
MATIMTAQTRESKAPNSVLTELRNGGFVPGVVYGYQTETLSITVSEKDLIRTLRETGRNGVISLEVDGNRTNVVLNDYQMDALKGSFEHVDFLAINMTEDLEVETVVHLIGESKGVEEGGVLNQPNREITLKVKPSDIPDAVEIDVTDLDIGDSLTVGDVRERIPYEILSEDDYVLVNVFAPRVEEEPETEETDEEAEAGAEETPAEGDKAANTAEDGEEAQE